MTIVFGWITAIYNFLVGDMIILIGTLIAIIIAALLATIAPTLAGVVLLVLVAAILTVALQRETPR